MRAEQRHADRIESEQTYRVFDGAEQTDQFTVVSITGPYALVARCHWDALERINLNDYQQQYTLRPVSR